MWTAWELEGSSLPEKQERQYLGQKHLLEQKWPALDQLICWITVVPTKQPLASDKPLGRIDLNKTEGFQKALKVNFLLFYKIRSVGWSVVEKEELETDLNARSPPQGRRLAFIFPIDRAASAR